MVIYCRAVQAKVGNMKLAKHIREELRGFQIWQG